MKRFRFLSNSFCYFVIALLLEAADASGNTDVNTAGSGGGLGPASPSVEAELDMFDLYSKMLDNLKRFRPGTRTGSADNIFPVESQPSATEEVEGDVEKMKVEEIRNYETRVGVEELRHIRKRSANPTGSSVGLPRESDKRDPKSTRRGDTSASIVAAVSRSGTRFPTPFCELELDSGIICPGVREGLQIEQFYYDADNNRCSHFFYNGCGGNANRFFSLWECTQSCVVA